MPFGKKYVSNFGVDQTNNISAANIEAAVVSWLYATRVVPEHVDILQINWSDLAGKKPLETIPVGIKIRKEV